MFYLSLRNRSTVNFNTPSDDVRYDIDCRKNKENAIFTKNPHNSSELWGRTRGFKGDKTDNLLSEFPAGKFGKKKLKHQGERDKQRQPDNDNNDPDHRSPFSGILHAWKTGHRTKKTTSRSTQYVKPSRHQPWHRGHSSSPKQSHSPWKTWKNNIHSGQLPGHWSPSR